MASAPRPTLLERMRGPNARPIDLLVERGTASAAHIARHYQGFARARVEEIARRLATLSGGAPDAEWQRFCDMVQDLRSSSATCGDETVSWVSGSWEKALDPQFRGEPRLMAVMQLHLDALRLAVSENAGGAELRALAGRLESVVKSLNPTGGTA